MRPTLVVQSVRITPLGEIFADASKTRHFDWINKFADPIVPRQLGKLYDKVMDAIDENKEGPLDPFVSCFPADSIDFAKLSSLSDSLHEDKPPIIYDCRLSYDNFSCIIRCSSLHTFDDLHDAIQKAVCFGNDHLYSFFLDGKKYSRNAVCCPYQKDEDSPKANEYTLGDAGLRNNQRILYLFDYGDDWMFDILVKVVKEEMDLPTVPLIIKVKGEPPEQYGSWDDY